MKITNEYDIIVRCQQPIQRTILLEKLTTYCNEIGVGITVENHRRSAMLRNAFTKRDCQNLLESFFRAVFQQDSLLNYRSTRTEILECELTRSEFADAMHLKEDSLFVEQMFQLIDTDGNGFISFREFLDMSVIFSKGSPEDKLKLMFEMYDVNKTGFLNREQFKMMDLVNASVSADPMDSVIESMFVAAGLQGKAELNLNDFNILLHEHKEELSNAHMTITAYDVEVPQAEPEKPPENTATGTIPYRMRHRAESAPSRARRTVFPAYSTHKLPHKEKTDKEKGVPTVNQAPVTKFKYLHILGRWVENNRLNIFYLSLFALITAAIFAERAYHYSVESEQGGLRRIAGYGVTIARGAASGMMWTYSILLITMSRNFITFLRDTPINYYVPLDSYIAFHKIVVVTALLFTFIHLIGHGFNFYHINTQTYTDLSCIFREVYYSTDYLPSFFYWLFLTMTGFSSFLLTLITIVIFIFATQYARRHTFQSFWFTHHWYVLFYIFMFLHGSGHWFRTLSLGTSSSALALCLPWTRLSALDERRSRLLWCVQRCCLPMCLDST